jgi:hypothetical protein
MNVNVPPEELERLLHVTTESMPEDVARVISQLTLTPAEVDRVAELSAIAKGSGLNEEQTDELDRLFIIGNLLATLKLRAKKALDEKQDHQEDVAEAAA